LRSNRECWPETFIDEPLAQFHLLKEKYLTKQPGRIPLPETAQQLWRQHKYSVLARDNMLYKKIGQLTTGMSPTDDFSALSRQLTQVLRQRPSHGGIHNSLLHMWGYVSSFYAGDKNKVQNWSHKRLLKETQALVMSEKPAYLISSTALSELATWLETDCH